MAPLTRRQTITATPQRTTNEPSESATPVISTQPVPSSAESMDVDNEKHASSNRYASRPRRQAAVQAQEKFMKPPTAHSQRTAGKTPSRVKQGSVDSEASSTTTEPRAFVDSGASQELGEPSTGQRTTGRTPSRSKRDSASSDHIPPTPTRTITLVDPVISSQTLSRSMVRKSGEDSASQNNEIEQSFPVTSREKNLEISALSFTTPTKKKPSVEATGPVEPRNVSKRESSEAELDLDADRKTKSRTTTPVPAVSGSSTKPETPPTVIKKPRRSLTVMPSRENDEQNLEFYALSPSTPTKRQLVDNADVVAFDASSKGSLEKRPEPNFSGSRSATPVQIKTPSPAKVASPAKFEAVLADSRSPKKVSQDDIVPSLSLSISKTNSQGVLEKSSAAINELVSENGIEIEPSTTESMPSKNATPPVSATLPTAAKNPRHRRPRKSKRTKRRLNNEHTTQLPNLPVIAVAVEKVAVVSSKKKPKVSANETSPQKPFSSSFSCDTVPVDLLARSSVDLLDIRPILSNDCKWLVMVSNSSLTYNKSSTAGSSVVRLYNTNTGKLVLNLMPPVGKAGKPSTSPIIDMKPHPLNSSQIYFLHADGAMWWYDIEDEVAVVEQPLVKNFPSNSPQAKLHAFHIAVNGQFYLLATLPSQKNRNTIGPCLYAVDTVEDANDPSDVSLETAGDSLENGKNPVFSKTSKKLRFLMASVDISARNPVAFDRRISPSSRQCAYVVALGDNSNETSPFAGSNKLMVRNLSPEDERDPSRRFRSHLLRGTGNQSDADGYFQQNQQQHRRFTCITSHPTQECIATGDSSGSITLWYNFRYSNAPVRTQMHWHMLPVEDLVFGGRFGTYLLSAGHEAVLCRWLVTSAEKEQLKFLPRLGAPIRHVVMPVDDGSSDSSSISATTCVAVCHYDNEIKLIDHTAWKVVGRVRPFLRNYLNAAAYIEPLMQCYLSAKNFIFNEAEQRRRRMRIQETDLLYPVGLNIDPRTQALVTNSTPGHLQFYSVHYDENLLNLDVGGMSLLTATATVDAMLRSLADKCYGAVSEERNLTTIPFARKLNAEVVQAEFDASGNWLVTADEWLPDDFPPVVNINIWSRNDGDEEANAENSGGFRRHAAISTPHYGEAESYRVVRMKIWPSSSSRSVSVLSDKQPFSANSLLIASFGEDGVLKLWTCAQRADKTWSCAWQHLLPLPERLREVCFNMWRRQMSPFCFASFPSMEEPGRNLFVICAVHRTVYLMDARTGAVVYALTDLLKESASSDADKKIDDDEAADYFVNVDAVISPTTQQREVLLFVSSMKTTLIVKLFMPTYDNSLIAQTSPSVAEDDAVQRDFRHSVSMQLPIRESRFVFNPLCEHFVAIGRPIAQLKQKTSINKVQKQQEDSENLLVIGRTTELHENSAGCTLLRLAKNIVSRPITHAVFVPYSVPPSSNTGFENNGVVEALIKSMQSRSLLILVDPDSQALLQILASRDGAELLNPTSVPESSERIDEKQESNVAENNEPAKNSKMTTWKQADAKNMFATLLSCAREKAVKEQKDLTAVSRPKILNENVRITTAPSPLKKIFDFTPAYAMPSLQNMLSMVIDGVDAVASFPAAKEEDEVDGKVRVEAKNIQPRDARGNETEKLADITEDYEPNAVESYDIICAKYGAIQKPMLTDDPDDVLDKIEPSVNNEDNDVHKFAVEKMEQVIADGVAWMTL